MTVVVDNTVPSNLELQVKEYGYSMHGDFRFSLWTHRPLNYESFIDIDIKLTVEDEHGTKVQCNIHVYVDDCNDRPEMVTQNIDAKEDSVYGDIIGVVVANDEDAGDTLRFKILKQRESLISPTCNIETKASCKWKLPKATMWVARLGSRLMKLHQVKENSANIKFVAVGPTVGFQLREWGNITYRLRILVADSTIHNEVAMSEY